MRRNYKVRYQLAGFKKGATIKDSDLPAGTDAQALVDGHFLTVESVEAVACPACVEQKEKSPPKFKSVDEAAVHYAEKHAGLVPPTEEDLNSG